MFPVLGAEFGVLQLSRAKTDATGVKFAKAVPRAWADYRRFCLGFSFLLAVQDVLDLLLRVKTTRTQNPQ